MYGKSPMDQLYVWYIVTLTGCMVSLQWIRWMYVTFLEDRLDAWFVVTGCIMYCDCSMDNVKFAMDQEDVYEASNGLARCMVHCNMMYPVR